MNVVNRFPPKRSDNVQMNKQKEIAGNTNSNRTHILLGMLTCVILPGLIYFNSLSAPFFFDDYANIVDNPDIKQISNLKASFENKRGSGIGRSDAFRPLTFISFSMNYHFGKLNPYGYRLFNLIIHIVTTLLIFVLSIKVFLRLLQIDNIIPSLFAAILFTVHPINTEVVTYISNRSDSLATMFYLSALLFFYKSQERKAYFYPVSLVCFILSLSSKEIAATLPAIILVFDYIVLSNWDGREVIKRKFVHLWYWVILALYVSLRYFYTGRVGDPGLHTYQNWTYYSYFITQSYVIISYIKLLIFPSGVSVDHLVEPAKSIFQIKPFLSTALLSLIFFLLFHIYRIRSRHSRFILFFSLWFFITLSTTSSFFPINDAMTDRRLYLSGWGFSLCVTYFYLICAEFLDGQKHSGKFTNLVLSILGIHVFLFAITTIHRNKLFKDPGLMWQDVISKYPNSARAYSKLGVIYYWDKKEYDKGLQFLQKSLELDPNEPLTYNNIGQIYGIKEKCDIAIQYFQKAIELDPNSAFGYSNLGSCYLAMGQYAKAVQSFQKAIELNPSLHVVHCNLALSYYGLNEYEMSIKCYQKAVHLNPDYFEAHDLLGQLYLERKQYEKAIEEFQIASMISPNNHDIQGKIALSQTMLTIR